MTPGNAEFCWHRSFHLSLPRDLHGLAVGCIASGIAISTLWALLIGAWMAVPFAGAELLLVIWAFWAVRQREGDSEEVSVEGDVFTLRACNAGNRTERQLNKRWATVVMRQRGARCQLYVRYAGLETEFARTATDVERAQLYESLRGHVQAKREY